MTLGEGSLLFGLAVNAVMMLVLAWAIVMRHRSDADTKTSLDEIHHLVNSSFTEQLRLRLATMEKALLLMREVLTLHRENGIEPTAETMDGIDRTEIEIGNLVAQILERTAPRPTRT